MAVLQRRIGLKDIRALKPGEIVWDGAVGGFHARRQQSKTVSYIVVYRTTEGRQRWQTIGRHGSPWTPETAREAAKRILGHVVDGADPAAEKHAKRKAASVAELCDLYIADAEAGRLLTRRKAAKKASTIATDKGRIERHIKPLLGSMKVAAVTREDVDGVHARRRRRQDGRQDQDREEARAGECARRQRHGEPHGGTAWLDLHLCRSPPDAAGQSGAWRYALRGRQARAAFE